MGRIFSDVPFRLLLAVPIMSIGSCGVVGDASDLAIAPCHKLVGEAESERVRTESVQHAQALHVGAGGGGGVAAASGTSATFFSEERINLIG